MAKDLFHDAVRNALIKDGWQITDDPFFLKVGGVRDVQQRIMKQPILQTVKDEESVG
jgi:hypothetical protein